MNVTPPAVPMPGTAGGGEREGLCGGNARQPPVQVPDDDVGGEPLLVPLIPGLQADEVEPVVRRGHGAQQAEAAHARVVLDARRVLEDGVELVMTPAVRSREAAGGSCALT